MGSGMKWIAFSDESRDKNICEHEKISNDKIQARVVFGKKISHEFDLQRTIWKVDLVYCVSVNKITRSGQENIEVIIGEIQYLRPVNTRRSKSRIWKQFTDFCSEKSYEDYGFNMRKKNSSDYKESVVKVLCNSTTKRRQIQKDLSKRKANGSANRIEKNN